MNFVFILGAQKMKNQMFLFNKSWWGRGIIALTIASILLAAAPISNALANSIGYYAPTASPTTGISSKYRWSSRSNTYTSNNRYASAYSSSKVMKLSTFGIATIPTNSTINGIEVTVKGYTTGRQANIDISWNNGTNFTTGTGSGVKTTSLTSSESILTLGGPTDT
jgi:hypothetical protein